MEISLSFRHPEFGKLLFWPGPEVPGSDADGVVLAALRSTDWTTVGGCWWCWWMLIPRDDWEYLKRGVEMVEACWNHQSTILVTFYHPEFGDENFGWELFIDSGVWPVSCGRNQELQSQVGQLELTSSGFWWFCRSCGASKMGGMKPTPSTHATSDTFLNKIYMVLLPLSLSKYWQKSISLKWLKWSQGFGFK